MVEPNIGQPYCWMVKPYLKAADRLIESLSVDGPPSLDALPVMLLYSHAVETALKSFLRLRGVPIEELRKNRRPYGHDLVGLFGGSLKLGLTLAPDDEKACARLVELLEDGPAGYQFRYSERALVSATPHWTREKVGVLWDAIRVEGRRAFAASTLAPAPNPESPQAVEVDMSIWVKPAK